MSSRTCHLVMALASAMTLVLSGCGGLEEEELEENIDPETLGGKADAPKWLKSIEIDWKCGETVAGKFTTTDNGHLYSFPAEAEQDITFSLKGSYAASKGAVLAVYDSASGKRVAYRRVTTSNQVSVSFTAQKTIEYLVAAYSATKTANGGYTLTATCQAAAVSCTSDATCAKGQFCQFAKGCGKTGAGVCAAITEMCTKDYSPVCGCDGKTYGNACEAAAAATSVDSKGACKAPVVKLDKTSCQVGETVKATVTNSTSKSIFLSGCSVFAWEKKDGSSWVSQGPAKVCMWEGYARELKAGAKLTETLTAKDRAGSWRLVAGYGVGCTTGKALSQAGCSQTLSAASATLTIKGCKLLAMPNPSTFCPNGKIVPKYDADGVCVAMYVCKPCQVSDCGPALTLKNELCDDGETISGPTGKCLADGWGSCEWEIVECP